MPLKEFHKSSMPEEIVKEILLMIQNGELRPGDIFPSEQELMRRTNVSRSSVREAMRALSMMKVIDVHPGRRTTITSLDPDILVEHLDFVLTLEDSNLRYLFEVRKLIEVSSARMAAERILPVECEKLQATLAEDAFNDEDVMLHRQVVEATKNPILIRIYATIERLSQTSRDRTGKMPGVREQSQKDHAQIVKAVVSRDPKAAEKAMLKHLTFIENNLMEDISSSAMAEAELRSKMDQA